MYEKLIKSKGFKLLEEYPHDQFHTKVFSKGYLTVSLTFEGNKLQTNDISIDEACLFKVSASQLLALSDLFNKTQSKEEDLLHADSNDYRERYDNQDE